MSAIAHAATIQGTRQTVTGTTYTTVASIASSNFVAGQKYLVRAVAGIDNPDTTNLLKARCVHGSTEFAGSEYIKDVLEAGTTRPYLYSFQYVWTAISGESFDLQICSGTAAITVGADHIVLVAVRLDADLTENTDWFWAVDEVADTLTTTPLDGGSVSFTPPAATDWLVLTSARHDSGSTARSYGSRISSAGTINDTTPNANREGEATTEFLLMGHARCFTGLGAVTQTFKEQSYNTQSNGDQRTHSSVFALNLHKFKERSSAYTTTAEVLGTTDWADPYHVGLSITPSVAGDVWVIAVGVFDCGAALRELAQRLQRDNGDRPDAHSATDYWESSNDATDETPFGLQDVESVTAAAHTYDWEGDCSSVTGAPQVVDRCLCVFTFELAAAAAPALFDHTVKNPLFNTLLRM